MVFLSPLFLLFVLGAGICLISFYLLMQRRKFKGLRYSNLDLIKQATKNKAWKRHIAPALFLLGALIVGISVARPEATMALPFNYNTVMLVVDISGSMAAADIKPTRMDAEKAALLDFVKYQGRSTKIGLVAFNGTAFTAQIPTVNKDSLRTAIAGLQPKGFTAIGDGLLMGLHDIFPEISTEKLSELTGRAPGSYTNAAIVLMTDGSNNSGQDPVEAARITADKGVRVYTLGMGSASTQVELDGNMVTVDFDEEPVKAIAEITKGTYTKVSSAEEVMKVYNELSTKVIVERNRMPLEWAFTGIGLVVLLGALGVALWI